MDAIISQWTVFLVVFLVISLWGYLCQVFARDPRQKKLANSLPGPPAWPLVGNLLEPLISGPNAITNLIECRKKYGPVFRLWMGKRLAVCFSSAVNVEEIFSSSKTAISKEGIFKPFRDAWGDGIFSSPVPLWKKQRKMFSFAFANSAMPYYVPSMIEIIKKNVEFLKKYENEEFDSWDIFPDLAFGVIMKTHFGLDVSKLTSANLTDFHNLAQQITAINLIRMTSPWCQFQFIDKLFFTKKLMKLRREMEVYAEKILEEKYSVPQDVNTTKKNGLDDVKLENHSENIIGAYMETAYKNYLETNNRKLLYDEIITTLAGGTDTSAISLGFAFLALAANQDIQNRLYDEIQNVFGDSDRDADIDDLDKLPYLQQVLQETLRLYPISPIVLRNVDEDTQIGNNFYPAGTQLIINIIGIHYNEEYYPNPTKFNPENFSKEACYLRPKHAYLPFGTGPRMCIGMNFAMVEMKLFTIAMLRKYSFHTTTKLENVKLTMHFFLVAEDGYKISIKPRKKI